MAVPLKKVETFDLNEAIRVEIRRGTSDPYKIAKKLAPMLPIEQARDLAIYGIKRIVQDIQSTNRRGSFAVDVKDGDSNVTAFNNDRWTNGVVFVPKVGYRRYRELTADDCIAVAIDREKRAQGHTEEAKRFRALAAAMKRHSVKTAGALPEQVRVEVLQ